MAKYKVGDRVRIVNHRTYYMNNFGDMDKWLGRVMTIRKMLPLGYRMVEDAFENSFQGWYWTDDMIAGLAEPMPEQRRGYDLKVVIRFSGNTTTARLMRGGTVVKTASARRNPADKYSHAKGAALALERLFEKKVAGKPKEASEPKIGDKFVVVSNSAHHHFTMGEIVTLIRLYTGVNLYKGADGAEWYCSDSDVVQYKGESK